MSPARTLISLLVLVAVASGSAADSSLASTTQTITSNGVSRTYLLYQPANLPAGPVPLMVALHGGTSPSPGGMESLTGFDSLADEQGFLVAYPASQSGGWHIGCCTAARSSPDDLEFIDDMIGHLVATDNVDPDRVYVTGFSVGAYMAYRMACESPDVAGVGSTGGSEILSTPCAPDHPVAVFEIHGTQDYYGGSCGGTSQSDEACQGAVGTSGYEPSVQEVNEQWRGTDACPATDSTQAFGSVTQDIWDPCEGGSGVRLDTIQEGGHCWPTPTTCGNFSASTAFWGFLSAHSLAAPPEEPGGEEPPAEEEPQGEPGPGEEPQPGDRNPTTDRPSAGAGQTAGPPPGEDPPRASCVVPDLRGRHLAAARRLAHRRGCDVGHVRRMGSSADDELVVRWQSLRSGTVHAARSKVGLVVGPLHAGPGAGARYRR